jgi:hypothetical protein
VEELRQRLEEKNRHIEKKTVTATQATQERNRLNNELNELRDHMDIKDRKINVLQRKVGPSLYGYHSPVLIFTFFCSSTSKHYYWDLRSFFFVYIFLEINLLRILVNLLFPP